MQNKKSGKSKLHHAINVVSPDKVRIAVKRCIRNERAQKSPWLLALRKRINCPQGNTGQWLMYGDNTILCTAQISLNDRDDYHETCQSFWRLQIFVIPTVANHDAFRSTYTNDQKGITLQQTLRLATVVTDVTTKAVQLILSHLSSDTLLVQIRVSGLDRSFVPLVTKVIEQSPIQFNIDKIVRCGLHICKVDPNQIESIISRAQVTQIMKGGCIRRLTTADAKVLNERWEHKSNRSIHVVKQILGSSLLYGCMGYEVDGKLRAWILRYMDGPLGLFWCDKEYRGFGIGQVLLSKCLLDYHAHGETTVVAYIVNGNIKSENCLKKFGFTYQTHADWITFSSRGKNILSRL